MKMKSEKEKTIDQMKREPLKRLNVDIPKSLHTQLDINCTLHDISISDYVRILLKKAVDEEETNKKK